MPGSRQSRLGIQATLIHQYASLVCRTAKVRWRSSEDETRTLWLCWHEHALVAGVAFIVAGPRPLPCIVGLLNRRGNALRRVYERFGGSFLQVTDRLRNGRPGARRDDILRHIQQVGPCLLTPDGPRGPRQVMKDGSKSLILDLETHSTWLTFKISRKIRLKRWDHLVIPLPFAAIDVVQSSTPPRTEEPKSTLLSRSFTDGAHQS